MKYKLTNVSRSIINFNGKVIEPGESIKVNEVIIHGRLKCERVEESEKPKKKVEKFEKPKKKIKEISLDLKNLKEDD